MNNDVKPSDINLQDTVDSNQKSVTDRQLDKSFMSKISPKETIDLIIKRSKDEINDNIEALKIINKIINSKINNKESITDVELKQLIDQLKDNLKVILFIALGVSPGSVITIPVLLKIAKKYNIDLKITKNFK